jgi:hypothetical protein
VFVWFVWFVVKEGRMRKKFYRKVEEGEEVKEGR